MARIMDLISELKPRKKARLGTRGAYTLTQLGKIKVEELAAEGAFWEVLAYLDEHGASSLSEIGEGCHMNDDKVKTVVGKLSRSGYVKKVESEK